MNEKYCILNREEILKANDLPTKIVPVPEWGKNAAVRIRGLTAKERDEFELTAIKEDFSGVTKAGMINFRAKLVALTVVDENGNNLFTLEDAEQLGKKSAQVLDRLFNEARTLSGFTKEDIEELTKN